MPNESQKRSPHQWEKWRAAGALGTSVEEIVRRERGAEKWAKAFLSLDDSKVSSEVLRRALDRVADVNRRWYQRALAEGDSGTNWQIPLLRAHPNLTLEQIATEGSGKYGSANNLVTYFELPRRKETDGTPHMILSIRERLDTGYLPRSSSQEEFLFWLMEDGLLERAFQTVGFSECQKFFENQRYIRMLADELRPTKGPWSYDSLNPSILNSYADVPPDVKARFSDAYVQHFNWQRKIIVALFDLGVNFKALYGSGNPFVAPNDTPAATL